MNGASGALPTPTTDPKATLTISDARASDAGEYTVVFSNSCGGVTSTAANVAVAGGCAADYNADTVLDLFDYLDFVGAFAANEPSADFNADTTIDFFDYLDFVAAFSNGC